MTPTKIVIHCSDSEDGPTFSASAIKRYHTKVLNWLDVGYHALVEFVDDDYFIIMGRPWDMDGAHTIGQNHIALGLCFIGKYDKKEPSDAMLREGAKQVKLWRKLYDIPLSAIHKHSEYANKTCPGTMFPWTKFLALCN